MPALEINLKPDWATQRTWIAPHINFGAEIDGPFEIQLDYDGRRISYERYYTYDHRDVRSRTPEDFVNDTLAIENWMDFPDNPPVIGQIFRLTYTYKPNGEIKKSIRVDQINDVDYTAFILASYDSEGNLHRNGRASDKKYRDRARAAGHFEAHELPEHIDFEATAQAFIEQINQLGAGIPFQKPQLIPAT